MNAPLPHQATDLASGKDHTKENFPVASAILKPQHRAPVMAFYRFARAADDVADHATASADEKLALLGGMRATIEGRSDADANSVALRETMAAYRLDPVHALDLLTAFERDCTIDRYYDWEALIDYCRYSAMPVGRYVLDVHGESRDTWPANDALCAALQVINHLQDCGKDYRAIGRVYLPLDILAEHGTSLEHLGPDKASPQLRAAITDLATRTEGLLATSRGFAGTVKDLRLSVEVAVIQRLAESLTARLKMRDPLSEKVHHGKVEMLGLAASAAIARLVFRR
ncbi:squalene synthase HpnC [Sphingomonas immobilis]|uniref:Squalene synthase HpnC n=1 Tax=Sphingomonas immobilis TaxID=3063997 RepID=A0ABT9A2U7_9SPHN|nr:squalene synthase HpnC [Sphingomonas sp. CA1-15]MDO7843052.1 squalene synthase HpnC [Sphingomonas sp. CA1-15]